MILGWQTAISCSPAVWFPRAASEIDSRQNVGGGAEGGDPRERGFQEVGGAEIVALKRVHEPTGDHEVRRNAVCVRNINGSSQNGVDKGIVDRSRSKLCSGRYRVVLAPVPAVKRLLICEVIIHIDA